MSEKTIITRVNPKKIDEDCQKVYTDVSASIAALVELIVTYQGDRIDEEGNIVKPIVDAYDKVTSNLYDKLSYIVHDTAMNIYTDGYLEAHEQLTSSICKLLSKTELDDVIIEAIKNVDKDLQEEYKPTGLTILKDEEGE